MATEQEQPRFVTLKSRSQDNYDQSDNADSPNTPYTPQSQQSSLSTPPPKIIKKSSSKLSVRIDTYRGTNAFQRNPFSCYERIKMVLMVITGIVIVRAILFAIIIILLYICSLPVTLCNTNLQKPLSCWR